MLIYMKNSFITDYADYADIQDSMKNRFITEFADYLVFNTRRELILSLTTLNTQILETTWKTILSWVRWYSWQYENNLITVYADYADFQY